MAEMPDLSPATQEMARLVRNIRDDQLTNRTPCPAYTLGDLVDHVDGLSLAFTWAATKAPAIADSQPPAPDASRLQPGWRERIGDQLETLAEAWQEPEAWSGMTRAGGVDLPGEVAGLVALNEVVVHAWDVARASGQEYHADPASLQVSMAFLQESAKPGQEHTREGIFGPVVPCAPDAPLLDRVAGLSGRDPGLGVAGRAQ
jgi:uncharacterized protein (TIGR03086 family)